MAILAFLFTCLLVAAVMGLLAWAIADELIRDGGMSGAIDRGVRRGVDKALAQAASPTGIIRQRIGEVIDDQMREMARTNRRIRGNLNPTQFVWKAAFLMMRTNVALAPMVAKGLAEAALNEFLINEKIGFGDERYAWDQVAAEGLIQEMEIDHWESAA